MIELLLDPNPTGDFLWGFAILALCFVCFYARALFGLVGKLIAPGAKEAYWRKSYKKRVWRFLPFGVIGFMLVFARFGEVPYLSMPLILLIWAVGLVGVSSWTKYQIFRDYFKRIASVKQSGKL